ncbi:hypothetical protein DL768_002849 [Monosporascus sp. mg162]|nr:hypothetical protein DL768_002849 [Monosporascus sp. mg162]
MPGNTASLLPTFPRIFFLYLEPVAIAYGMYANYAQAKPLLALSARSPTPLEVPALFLPSVVCQFLLTTMLYGLAVLLSSPPNGRLLRLHIGILVLADLTHWYGLFSTMAQADPQRGWGAALDAGTWSADVWNLVFYPVVTLSIKIATLAGWFGEIRGQKTSGTMSFYVDSGP